ncbi:MAG: hypothetical protein GKR94_07765 [Gammaproteobacteria bacterium]|nr:hypothetical protein [Gammaproteobacteria bacterium]
MNDPQDGIAITVEGPVFTINIDRPAARNALTAGAARALHGALRSFEGDDTARAAVLHGRHGGCA